LRKKELRSVITKSTGIVRKLDDLGRLCLPIELRRLLNIETKDGLEIFIDNDRIILRKHQVFCIFCGDVHGMTKIMGKNVCQKCLADVSKKVV
jgi:transcriptional pleiotropic regulator of transition state genes